MAYTDFIAELNDALAGIKVTDYPLELFFITLLVIYALFYNRGNAANLALARRWIQKNKAFICSQFSTVGNATGLLIGYGPSKYVLWCTGRANCEYLTGMWQLKRRHDLANVVLDFVSSTYDRLIIEVKPDNEAMSAFVFCVASNKAEKGMRDKFKDLQNYGDKQSPSALGLPSSLSVWADSFEVAQKVVANGLGKFAEKYESYIEYIHMSDQYQEPDPELGDERLAPPEKRLRFSFRVPRQGSMDETSALLEFVVQCIDNVKLNLSANAKAKGEKLRAKAEKERQHAEQLERQEANQLRAEERRAELKKSLDEDGRRKQEEKEAKRERRKKASKGRLMMAF